MNIKVAGIDLAKNVFQVCVLLHDGTIDYNRKVARSKLIHVIRQLPKGTLIAMEACGSCHYWGRAFSSMGYNVKLLPTQHVKPFVGCQKNDANDALAICEAAFRPGIYAVSIKTVEQQDIKALRCVRQRLVDQRTAVANQIRAMAAENGVIFSIGLNQLRKQLPSALEDAENDLSTTMRRLLNNLYEELVGLSQDIDSITGEIQSLCQQHPRYKALMSIPGIGPIITASLLSELGTGEQFDNGRQFSAWCGLVPRQYSSGGKSTLGAITKNGNRELRTMIIHGARAVIRYADKRQDAMGKWLKSLISRRGKVKTIIALANKLARIAWRILTGTNDFNMKQAFRGA